MQTVTDADLVSWIEQSIEKENLVNYKIKLTGKSEKGDGYNSEIVFANVLGTTKENETKNLDLAIKHATPEEHLRKLTPVRKLFEGEINFYTNIIPTFGKFQEECGVLDIFDAMPKCYGTILLDNMEVIIMDNLKAKGFKLHDRKNPLNADHQKKVLKEYGKFHALSFALRDKRPQIFSILKDDFDLTKEILKDKVVRDSFQMALDHAINLFEERGEFALTERVRKILPKGAGEILCDLVNEDISETTFAHGDCWNNNYMYKYEKGNQTTPSDVVILDWQFVGLRSPVFDLSHLIYATSSKKELDKFDELIGVYYSSFSSHLRALNCDPDELFPLSTLKEHWRRYSLYGLLYIPLILKYILCDPERVPERKDIQESSPVLFPELAVNEIDLYYNRLKDAFTHFIEFEFN